MNQTDDMCLLTECDEEQWDANVFTVNTQLRFDDIIGITGWGIFLRHSVTWYQCKSRSQKEEWSRIDNAAAPIPLNTNKDKHCI